MAISVFTGRPGEGKTYLMVKKAWPYLLAGIDVYSNFKLDYEGENIHYYRDFSDLADVSSGLILIDEGQYLFNSRNWDNLTLEAQYKLQQHRKDGLNIWLTTQNIQRLDVVLRELVHNYYRCSKVVDIAGKFILFILYTLDVDQITKEEKTVLSRSWHFHFWDTVPKYDTMAKIPIPNQEYITKRFVKCKDCGREHPAK